FATIVKAVTNGRNVYTNIKNSIRFLLSGNTAGILAVLYTSIMGLAVPFAPVHLLFINLLTDSLPAIAIGMEPATHDLLNQPPRDPKEPILTKKLLGAVLFEGALIAIATMGGYHIGMEQGGATLAMTMAFATLTLARLFHGFNCRGTASIFKLGFKSNKYSVGAFFLGVLLLAAVLFVPGLKHLFMVADAFTLTHAGMVALLAFAPTVVIQIKKLIQGH
ncbi:MAG: cation transporting ATPase C-terminal domain-containing protein, partial [Oscillospiraceae bacterium]